MRAIKLALIAAFILVATATAAKSQPSAEAAAIKQTALDYIEGYYEGNAERMERVLHPDLAKRIVRPQPNGRSALGQMSAMTLVQATRAGGRQRHAEG